MEKVGVLFDLDGTLWEVTDITYESANEITKKYKIPEYTEMLLTNELKSYLLDIEDECKERLELLIKQISEEENVNEELKANNQIEWVQKMNNIKSRAEEIILNEIIYL